MRILILGHGKTGKLVAEVAAQRGHGVHVLDAKENQNASGLTGASINTFDVVIDFTTPEAVLPNLRALLANGARVVVGTTGWYDQLDQMKDLAGRKGASLLYGTNYSVGVQVMLQLARQMAASLPGYTFAIEETHHVTKLDSPSGTAVSLQQAAAAAGEVPIHSHRVGDAAGLHVLTATSDVDKLTLQHESFSRQAFAEGAVRAAEWLVKQKPGNYNFSEVFDKL